MSATSENNPRGHCLGSSNHWFPVLKITFHTPLMAEFRRATIFEREIVKPRFHESIITTHSFSMDFSLVALCLDILGKGVN